MSTGLIPLSSPNPPELFRPGGLDTILRRLEEDARAVVADVATKAGRAAIASNAARVARSKTYLDDLGKQYVAELKALPVQVDAERRAMRERLDALKEEVRKPLTEWEEAEEARETAVRQIVASLTAPIEIGSSVEEIEARLASVSALVIPADLYPHQREQIEQERMKALPRLEAAVAKAREDREREIALEQMRREAAEREQREREERIRREAAEHARLEAEDRARREAERQERERAQAVRLQEEAERRAAEAEERARREAAASEARAQAAAEYAARQERERAEREAAEVEAARKRREMNRLHRAGVQLAAIDGLHTLGVPKDLAEAIIKAVDAGEIQHMTINY